MDYRLPPNQRASTAVPIIIMINVTVFFLWLILSNDQTPSPFMSDHFLVSWDQLRNGRFWTTMTSTFSHQLFWHLFLNMYVLGSFGEIVEDALGSWRFVSLYLTAGIISSLSHSMVSAFLLHRPDWPALGASGAISGILLYFALMLPKQRIYFLGIIPVPAIWGALTLVGLDIWGLLEQAEGAGLPIGHGAHLGGAITGAVYYFWTRLHHTISASQFRWHQWR